MEVSATFLKQAIRSFQHISCHFINSNEVILTSQQVNSLLVTFCSLHLRQKEGNCFKTVYEQYLTLAAMFGYHSLKPLSRVELYPDRPRNVQFAPFRDFVVGGLGGWNKGGNLGVEGARTLRETERGKEGGILEILHSSCYLSSANADHASAPLELNLGRGLGRDET